MPDFSATYTVDGYRGIAFRISPNEIRERDEEGYELDVYEDPNFVIGVMVGDDREHLIDVDDLTPISEDDYCAGCGQIGCGH